jgi:hypothetical protein
MGHVDVEVILQRILVVWGNRYCLPSWTVNGTIASLSVGDIVVVAAPVIIIKTIVIVLVMGALSQK